MKLITAIIREQKLDQVRESLIEAGISRITVSRVAGHGQQIKEEIYRGKKVIPSLIPKVKMEIAVNAEFVDTTINAIMNSAKSNDIGDGKIWVTTIEEIIRIRTGEKGKTAI